MLFYAWFIKLDKSSAEKFGLFASEQTNQATSGAGLPL